MNCLGMAPTMQVLDAILRHPAGLWVRSIHFADRLSTLLATQPEMVCKSSSTYVAERTPSWRSQWQSFLHGTKLHGCRAHLAKTRWRDSKQGAGFIRTAIGSRSVGRATCFPSLTRESKTEKTSYTPTSLSPSDSCIDRNGDGGDRVRLEYGHLRTGGGAPQRYAAARMRPFAYPMIPVVLRPRQTEGLTMVESTQCTSRRKAPFQWPT